MAAGPITVQKSANRQIADYSAYARFKSEEVLYPDNPPGPKTFKFPLDDVSAGNFWTKLVVNSWVPVRPAEELVDKQGHKLNRYHIANIWLPMPEGLSTKYDQSFSETDDMLMNRGTGFDVTSWSGAGATIMNQFKAIGAQMGQELTKTVASAVNVNNSGKMNLGSIVNQMMGLVYDGAQLREHTLSWKMTPKSKEEQARIAQVVFALKKYSAPIIMDPRGGDVNHETSVKASEEATKEIADFTQKIGQLNLAGETQFAEILKKQRQAVLEALEAKEAIQDSMRNIGRLGIPATINAEFWFGDAVNPNLFQIKDSFIEQVDVNYTPEGGWNAYKDGAPIATQLTITFKENAVLSQKDIYGSGGY